MAYDINRDRYILFFTDPNASNPNEQAIWEYSPTTDTWMPILKRKRPPATKGHGQVYLSGEDLYVHFGGNRLTTGPSDTCDLGSTLADGNCWAPGTWSSTHRHKLDLGHRHGPAPRKDHAVVYSLNKMRLCFLVAPMMRTETVWVPNVI